MFAIVKTGGKQYSVKLGDVFKVEKLESEPSSTVLLNDVLLIASNDEKIVTGTPSIEGAFVKAEVMKHVRNKKIIVFKKKRRHNYRRKNGHRQPMTVLKVTEIFMKGA
ncbi:MAG: 50S ribosomal protein L21 [Holosporales bacterium]|jgi:large subunit ribosomal protein L21|nr:50S ribosomal protein L21 [Holosporales bacterium]